MLKDRYPTYQYLKIDIAGQDAGMTGAEGPSQEGRE